MPGGRKPQANSPERKTRTVTSPTRRIRAPLAEKMPTKTFEEHAPKKREKNCVAKGGNKTREKKSAKGSGSREPSPEKTTEDIETTTAQVMPRRNHTAKGRREKMCRIQTKSLVEDDATSNKLNCRKDKEAKAFEYDESPMKGTLEESMRQLSLEDSRDVSKETKPSTILDQTLNASLNKLKIRMQEKSKVSGVINRIEKIILEHLKKNTTCFKDVKEPVHTGSYYENLKISNPDEFDIMFPIHVPRLEIQPFSEDGAFYVASLKRELQYCPLPKEGEDKRLPASKILQEFRKEVIKSISDVQGVRHNEKKRGCPAVTLSVEVDSHLISIDIVFCLVVNGAWPAFTEDGLKIEAWLGRKERKNYKFKPYYLVAKYEGKGTPESKDCWRISFSHVEKDIIKNHGSEKTCCEKDGARCCRKDCVKLLKYLLNLLKEEDKSYDKFCSYHAKTTFLHACCTRPKDSQWAAADLTQCFEQLVQDFENHLETRQLNNFFIPTQNLLSGCSQKSCISLALRIKKERGGGFPIFRC